LIAISTMMAAGASAVLNSAFAWARPVVDDHRKR
jgi:hypothetical protein